MTTETTQPSHQPTQQVDPTEPMAHVPPTRERAHRGRYDYEFKLLVVARIERGGVRPKDLAAALRLSPWVVYQWRREMAEEAAAIFPDTTALSKENDQLKCALKAFVGSFNVLQNLFAEDNPAPVKLTPSLASLTPSLLGDLRLRDMYSSAELTELIREARANQPHAV